MDHKIAAERIAAAFEAGIAPWSRPSHLGHACRLPWNSRTGIPYRGIDAWLLELAAIGRGYRTSCWATATEWRHLGARVVRDEPIPVLSDDAPHAGEDQQSSGLFPLEQVRVRGDARIAERLRSRLPPRTPDYDRAERLVEVAGVRIERDAGPCYRRDGSREWIGMPPAWHFTGVDEYWSVLFHELIHHVVLGPHGLGWDGDSVQGELVAEMGAAILADRYAVPMRGDLDVHRGHDLGDLIAGWVAGIRGDGAYLVDACDLAWRAADYLAAVDRLEPGLGGGIRRCGGESNTPRRWRER